MIYICGYFGSEMAFEHPLLRKVLNQYIHPETVKLQSHYVDT